VQPNEHGASAHNLFCFWQFLTRSKELRTQKSRLTHCQYGNPSGTEPPVISTDVDQAITRPDAVSTRLVAVFNGYQVRKNRRSTFGILCILLSIVVAIPSMARAEHLSLPTVDHVIHISVDGLRADVLRELIATSPSSYPNFYRLESEGGYTYNARTDFTQTETIPNHLAMVTGRPVSQPAAQPNTVHHGYTNNFPRPGDTVHAQGNPEVPYKWSVFDVVHDQGMSTAVYAAKTRLEILDRSYTDKIDVSQYVNDTSAGIVDSLVTNMTVAPHNYTFLHITETDGAGHAAGWVSQRYNEAVATADARLGELFGLIDTSPALRDNTALIITTDHGGGVGRPRGGFGGPNVRAHDDPEAAVNYTIPFFVWGAGLPAGSSLYDALTNRFDPADQRYDYDAVRQPLRNGDSGNIALALLGLDPIPGSTLIPDYHEFSPYGTALQAGDADMDLDLDQLDLVHVQIAAKYLTGQPATWGEGDWNGNPSGSQGSPPVGDGLFNQLDIIAAQQAANYLTGPYAAIESNGQSDDDQSSIGYDARSGEVWIDAPAGMELSSINIDSVAGIFTGQSAQNLGGSFDNDADANIFKATFGGSFGSVSFGNVAQTGLSEEFVLGDLSVVGSLAGGGELGSVDLVYVPEPTSVLLLSVGLVIGLLHFRRVKP
jgi:hypothetical protein